MMDKVRLKRNFSAAFLAQAVGLLVSCSTNLFLPKVVGEYEFSYWQLFIFYASYIPCLALGINDGVYLRYGGIERAKMDFGAIKSQYFVGLLYQMALALVGYGLACYLIEDAYRLLIVSAVFVYYLFFTAHNFLGYVFQAANEVDVYCRSLLGGKIFYFAFQSLLLFMAVEGAMPFVAFYIASYALAFIYLLSAIRGDIWGAAFDFRRGAREAVVSIKVGISLMVSNVCAMLVLGVGRQVIDLHWGIIEFGKVSFALTLMNFALVFVSQVGMVLFPALRQLGEAELTSVYKKLTLMLFKFLPLIYIFYFPAAYGLSVWLPEYQESIRLLSLMLPICYFDCRMNLIGNTFYKVLSKQVDLLKINLLTIGICLVFSALGAYLWENVYVVVAGMVLAVVFRSVLADAWLMEEVGFAILRYDLCDIALAVLFVAAGNYLSVPLTVLLMSVAIGLRLGLMKKWEEGAGCEKG